MRGIKIELTPEQERWMRAHFKHTLNDDIMERFGWSEGTLHRFARRLGLKKTPQFRRKTQLNAAAKAKASHLKNGTYPPKGYIIPGSEEYRFRKGETGVQRLGKRGERKRIERSVESRRKTIREEKARILFGLPRKTRLRLVKRPRYVALQRHYLRQLGYVIERGSLTAYYGPETRRSAYYEARTRESCKRYVHFEFKDISELNAN